MVDKKKRPIPAGKRALKRAVDEGKKVTPLEKSMRAEAEKKKK